MKYCNLRLYLVVLLSLFGWWAGATTAWADGTKHYLAFASDRHQNMSQVDSNTPVVSTAMSCWSDLPVEYVSLIGDMVGKSGGDAPTYDVKTVWDEVSEVFPSLSVDRFSIIWADHDGGYTDNNTLGVMKVPSTSKTDYGGKSTQIYTDAEHNYYIYAVNYYEMLNTTTTEPEAFKQWVDGIDKKAVVIVLCHAPMHYKRKDNMNGENWCNALNYAATGSENGTEVTRNVVFFHGHNHTTENAEYYYEPGSQVDMQGASGSVSKTIQFTYITAGYMKKPSGASTVNATLVTMDDDVITFTKSKSGSTSELGSVQRVEQGEVVYYTVTFESNGGTEVAPQQVKQGATVTKPADPTREGYTFAGWYYDPELTDGSAFNFEAAMYDNLTLYAKWTETKVFHTITFDTQGGSTIEPVQVEDGELLPRPEDPVREGYEFLGWYWDPMYQQSYFFDTPVTGDYTIYAQWVAREDYWSVTFNSNGGSEVATQIVVAGTPATEPEDPVREGYEFRGWYADEALTVPYDFSQPVTATLTLYAKWSAGKCATPVLTFENGKVVCSCETENVVYVYEMALTSSSGTSTDGILTIGNKVVVSVKAVRDGWDDSDVATMEISPWQVGDVNGDGTITIADVTALVNIILEK